MEKLCGVYKITSKKTGKFYYGSSKDIRKRKRQHLATLLRGTHQNINLQKLYAKHGDDDLTFTVVKLTDRDTAYHIEDKLIRKSADDRKCLNICLGSVGGDTITRHANREDIIKRRTKTVLRNMSLLSDSDRKDIYGKTGEANGMYGRTHTKQARKIMSDVNLGHSRNKGIPKSEEGRLNMKAAAVKRASASDYINPFEGKTHSKKTKQVLSNAANAKYAAGFLPGNTRKVKIGKKIYKSLTEAGRQLGVVTATVLNRIRSKSYPEYSYLD